jgi:hypothetical protein
MECEMVDCSFHYPSAWRRGVQVDPGHPRAIFICLKGEGNSSWIYVFKDLGRVSGFSGLTYTPELGLTKDSNSSGPVLTSG